MNNINVAPTFLYVRNHNQIFQIKLSEILFVTVEDKYLRIKYGNQQVLITSSLTEFMKKFPDVLLRIHQSHAVNEKFVDKIDLRNNQIHLIGGEKLRLSRNYKSAIMKKVKSYYFA